jgi:hypothetical protein
MLVRAMPSSSLARLHGCLAAGLVLLALPVGAQRDRFGVSVTWMGDVNEDGVDDFAVGTFPQTARSSAAGSGFAEIRSGRDGALVRRIEGDRAGDYFGKTVACVGDVDEDGMLDLAIAAGVVTDSGYVRVVSGRSGAKLFDIGPIRQEFHCALGSVQVEDGGRLAILVGGPRTIRIDETGSHHQIGVLRAFSSKDGRMLFSREEESTPSFASALATRPDEPSAAVLVGSSGDRRVYRCRGNELACTELIQLSIRYQGLGETLDWGDDVDGDGQPDFIAGAGGSGDETDFPAFHGSAFIVSGHDGKILRELRGRHEFQCFGRVVSLGGDTNGDSSPDAAVGEPEFPNSDQDPARRGSVSVFDARDGRLLGRIEGEEGARFGTALAIGRDLDADGCADILIGAPGGQHPENLPGRVLVISGKDRKVLYSVHASR